MNHSWEAWHQFWTRLFGKRVPTSADRAHIDNLLLAYRTGPEDEAWWDAGAFTDANRVHRIGNLYIFDYGNTPLETKESAYQHPPREMWKENNAALLAENIKKYRMSND